MPYIEQCLRDKLDPMIKPIADFLRHRPAHNVAGLVNYVITKLVIELWLNCRSYHMANAIVGMFECAKLEFVRRYLNDYEDEKIEENGDVHSY